MAHNNICFVLTETLSVLYMLCSFDKSASISVIILFITAVVVLLMSCCLFGTKTGVLVRLLVILPRIQ